MTLVFLRIKRGLRMSRKTEYLKLHLPEENEFYNVEKDQN